MAIARATDRSQCRVGVHMTRSGTVAQFADGVIGDTTDFGMFASTIIAGMTTRTIWTVAAITPSRRVGIAGMTIGTIQIQTGSMVAWILRRSMRKGQRRPRSGAVAHATVARGRHVTTGFAGCRRAVVTFGATTSDAGMTKRRRCPS